MFFVVSQPSKEELHANAMKHIEYLFPLINKVLHAYLHNDDDDAEECFHNLLEIICKKEARLYNHPNPEGWIMKTLMLCIKKQRRKISKRTHDISLDVIAGTVQLKYDENEDEDDIFDDRMIEQAKATVLGQLTESERQVYEMKYSEKMSENKIAERLGISRSAVSMRIFRTREKIKDFSRMYFE
ncbi:MAG: sigma-70 family RNA polymerase sigma factor [Clostridia bacterium]|nr:sigma-70 family RNA polymerase sigma factor [Clostridia bacterium]